MPESTVAQSLPEPIARMILEKLQQMYRVQLRQALLARHHEWDDAASQLGQLYGYLETAEALLGRRFGLIEVLFVPLPQFVEGWDDDADVPPELWIEMRAHAERFDLGWDEYDQDRMEQAIARQQERANR